MTCPNATSPINIVKNLAGVCELKCEYEQQYKNTSVSAENKGEYIRYTFSSLDTPVIFNAEKYTVGEMRLYQPSLHTYGGSHCKGELLIYHTNVTKNKNLILSIPIVGGASSVGVLDSLINQVSERANSSGGQTNIGLPSFNLSNLVPNDPFYHYEGTLPVMPCIGNEQYIVFDTSSAVAVLNDTLRNLKKIIKAHTYTTKRNPNGYYYNKKGPKQGLADDIYIECNPTGADGTVLVNEGQTSTDSDESIFDKIESLFNNVWFDVLFGIFVLVLIIKIFSFLYKKIFSSPKSAK